MRLSRPSRGQHRTGAPRPEKAPKAWYLLPEKPAEGLLTTEEWIEIGSIFGLTGRELDVAILIFEDRTRASMARRLSRSSGGIRKRVDRVFRKLNVKGKLGLVQRIWHVHRALRSGAGNGALDGAQRCSL
jgi:DNA-binding CsgD family transcriptional regulator